MSHTIADIHHPTPGIWTEVASRDHVEKQLGEYLAGKPQRELAERPFSIAVKANIGVAGLQRSAGCLALANTPEPVDAPVVASLRSAGAVVVGITNMHELAFGITSNNPSFGQVPLPGHAGHGAGGSSGGSAAAVAEGSVDVALGTDTGGSVSIPASHCGVFGFRPTTGRWPGAGIVGLSWTRDTPGVFARTLDQISSIDSLVTNEPLRPRSTGKLRLGVPLQFLEDLDQRTESAFKSALKALDHELELVEVDYSSVLLETSAAEMPVVLWEAKRLLANAASEVFGTPPVTAFEQLLDRIASKDVAKLLQSERENPVTSEEYQIAQRQVANVRMSYTDIFNKHQLDALVFPSVPAPAPPLNTIETVEHNGREENAFLVHTRHTGQGTMLGAPMITIPLSVGTDFLPIGVTIQGQRFADMDLITVANQICQRLQAN